MKKRIIFVLAVVLLLCGCEKTIPKLKGGKEAVVSFEKIDSISTEDLYEELKDAYATEIISDMIDRKMLEDKYKDTDVRKITEALVEVKKYDKLIGTFIDKLGADALANGGKIFAEFNSYGTKTDWILQDYPD